MTHRLDPKSFTKTYRDPAACRTALANYRWLAGIGTGLGLPRLVAAGPDRLVFEHVPGRHAIPSDLVPLASQLGDLHGAAHVDVLADARLDIPFVADAGLRIPDFLSPRLSALAARLAAGLVPDPLLDLPQAISLLGAAVDGATALYKDANPRNFLLTPGGPVAVDFDDLTLAPFGYDLAKLIVTLAMTNGQVPISAIQQALDAYNRAADARRLGLGQVSLAALLTWAEIHHLLTSPYLGRNGYRFGWHTLRPARLDPRPLTIEATPWR
jgi:Ser/Thr protein kinase RdoA (MazF antagonist)